MSQILRRIESLFMAETLSSGAAAAGFSDKTTGSHERSHGPSGGWNIGDQQRIKELFLEALVASERLMGVTWKDDRYVARKNKPFDERKWHIHILSNPDYVGMVSSEVAAEESCQEWDIRNLRRRHGRDSKGLDDPKAKCQVKVCSICEAVSSLGE